MHFTSAAGNASRPPPPCKRRVIKPTAKIPCGLGLGRFISLPTPAPAGPAPELHAQFAPHWRAGQPSCTASLPRRFHRPTTVAQAGRNACRDAVPYAGTQLCTSPPQPRHWPEDLSPATTKVVTKVVTEPVISEIPTQKRVSVSSKDGLLCSQFRVIDSPHRNLDSRSITP